MNTEAARPVVSVVIPCFNQGHYLRTAIASVKRQSYEPIELIVVDDGSTDDTAAVAQNLGVRLIRQANAGVAAARNTGLAAAGGELIVMLDADDELLPDAVAIGAGALAANPRASVVVGLCQSMDAAGQPLPAPHYPVDRDNLYAEWLSRNFVWTPGAAMFRRDALARAGGFPPAFGGAADYALYLHFARSGGVHCHLNEVVRYRQHDASMSRDPATMLRVTLDVLRRERQAVPPHLRGEITRAARSWCSWYGEQIPDRVRQDWRAGRRGRAQLASLWTFVRYCPRAAGRRAARRLLRALAAATGTPRPTPADESARGRESDAR